VLLTITFPRLRIIWSSSPYATSDIFLDFKKNQPEPDPHKAIAIGGEDGTDEAGAVNQSAEDLLRSLPGVTSKNYKYIMGRVGSVKELCELELSEMQEIMGNEPGKVCHEFLHHGLKNRLS